MLIRNVFLDKAALVTHCGFFRFGLLLLVTKLLFHKLVECLSDRIGGSLGLTVAVLADKFSRSMGCLANLEERMHRVNTLGFTVLAEVVVRANRAHVADASDRVAIAGIASELGMLFGILLLSASANVVIEHLLE
jgi:hypothetical protein